MKKIITLISFLVISAAAFTQNLPKTSNDVSPLLIGENIPTAILKTIDGADYNLHDNLNGHKSILLFYRGGWCPYCSRQLADFGGIHADLIKLGYKIAAISADQPNKAGETAKKLPSDLVLLSDSDGKFSSNLGIAFQAPEAYKKTLSGNANPNFLPVPSVFFIDEKGKILFEYISPNFKARMPSDLLMQVANYFAQKDK